MSKHTVLGVIAKMALLPCFLLAATPVDKPRTYLVSIVDVPLAPGESIQSFSISTWGVEFRKVCSIPGGWRITAGSSATPDGNLDGTGSHGATWFSRSSPTELRDFVLVTLYGPIQHADIANGPDATFKGNAMISTRDDERKATLTSRNIRLVPARGCR
ncbi:hypothetical protein [Sphingomonas sp. LT1P40]|uniref:hypothetical protein n=1 Tax=Alteristakelama amylovorans TaxID=3096166 RepID=UPI002FC94CA2